jgi:hypothetical protein
VASAKQIILDKGALLYKRMSGKIISMKYWQLDGFVKRGKI